MMKYCAAFIAGVLVAAGIFFFVMRHQAARRNETFGVRDLLSTRDAVVRRLEETDRDITTRLAAFAGVVSDDQMFSLRLIVENNVSAPEVTGKAAQFMGPMGFSLLEITDASYTILSSGHFPASRGESIRDNAQRLSDEPALAEETVMGRKLLTLQARTSFTIADSIRFYALGGVTVDEQFLAALSPREDVKIMLKTGDEIIGMKDVRTISEVKDGTVIINGKKYPAFQVSLAAVGFDHAPVLIVAVMEPVR